jgi:hypothetical protein
MSDNDQINLGDGGTVFVCGSIGADGLAGDLGEGETFTMPDGCTVTVATGPHR